MAENENKNGTKLHTSKNNSLPFRPNLTSLSNQTFKTQAEEDTLYSGMSLNELLNRKKRIINKDEDMSYAATMINQIKEENQKRTKKNKIILLFMLGGILVILLLLVIFFPQLSEIVKV